MRLKGSPFFCATISSMDDHRDKDKIVESLSSKFKDLSLDKRYEYLESLGLPAFIVQTVDIDNEPQEAAQSVFDCIAINAPEYLEKIF